jgi:hypothetical protein
MRQKKKIALEIAAKIASINRPKDVNNTTYSSLVCGRKG